MKFSIETGPRGGIRFDVQDPPPAGMKLRTTDGAIVTFDEIGMAGMLACTDCNGVQHLLFPGQIVVASVDTENDKLGVSPGAL